MERSGTAGCLPPGPGGGGELRQPAAVPGRWPPPGFARRSEAKRVGCRAGVSPAEAGRCGESSSVAGWGHRPAWNGEVCVCGGGGRR